MAGSLNQKVIANAARGTEWGQFLQYVSPALLEVMPMRALMGQARRLAANASSRKRFTAVKQGVAAHLARIDPTFRLQPDGSALTVADLSADQRREIGERVLRVYFLQLLAHDHAILDLRARRFCAAPEGGLDWFPRPFYLQWDPTFLVGLRDMYAGFYRDDEAGFARGVEALNLGPAGDILRDHFGADDQSNVRFSSEVFHATFQQAFSACREHGRTLHGNFIALGIYLACLYDILEVLGESYDVRAAYEQVFALDNA